jgi:hypothetical protein
MVEIPLLHYVGNTVTALWWEYRYCTMVEIPLLHYVGNTVTALWWKYRYCTMVEIPLLYYGDEMLENYKTTKRNEKKKIRYC